MPTSSQTEDAKMDPSAHHYVQPTLSKVLRLTEHKILFTKDSMNLFSNLMLSLKLGSHRVRFRRYEHTFTSEEAIGSLGSLKFSESNRVMDPRDSSHVVTTTTTTFFSMSKEMACLVCQQFVDALYIEAIVDTGHLTFPLRGVTFQVSPKGINILERFCQRNGIKSHHVIGIIQSSRKSMQLVSLERNTETDELLHDRATIELLFLQFDRKDSPIIGGATCTFENDLSSGYFHGLTNVKIAEKRELKSGQAHKNLFTRVEVVDWLRKFSTTVSPQEAQVIVEWFVKYDLMATVLDSSALPDRDKNEIFQLSNCTWENTRDTLFSKCQMQTHSGNALLEYILQVPALRLLFRDFLHNSLCEENLAFFLDVSEFLANYHMAENSDSLDAAGSVRATLAIAYGLYNTFLAPGSPCELNIDHVLRKDLAVSMTRTAETEGTVLQNLREIVHLFGLAQAIALKLMSRVG